MNMSLTRLTISIDEKQNQKLKELSQDQDQSLSHIIRTAIDAFITNDEDVHTNYEDTQNTNFEDKYVEHLEKTNDQLSIELEQKTLTISQFLNSVFLFFLFLLNPTHVPTFKWLGSPLPTISYQSFFHFSLYW